MPLDYLFVGSWKNFLLTRFHICLMVKNATTWIYSKKCTCLFLLSFKFPKDPKVWQHFCIGNAFHLKMVHAVELLKVCRLGGIKSTIGYSRLASILWIWFILKCKVVEICNLRPIIHFYYFYYLACQIYRINSPFRGDLGQVSSI